MTKSFFLFFFIILVFFSKCIELCPFSDLQQPSSEEPLMRVHVLCKRLSDIFFANNVISELNSGAPGLVDRVFDVHAGSRGFDSHGRHMSERFF